jgi:dolichyl-phosphate beta-glucosyltransferase
MERISPLWDGIVEHIGIRNIPTPVLLLYLAGFAVAVIALVNSPPRVKLMTSWRISLILPLACHQLYLALVAVAPYPRKPYKSEKTYETIHADGSIAQGEALPCWFDRWDAERNDARKNGRHRIDGVDLEEAEVMISIVVPAYNEEARLAGMLEEAVEFLQEEYGNGHGPNAKRGKQNASNGTLEKKNKNEMTGWEIIVVSDGSSDKTTQVALDFARDHQLSTNPKTPAGPWKGKHEASARIPPGSIRVVTLEKNRGKGGAVVHGMRHVRGKYALFADADGASRIEDLAALVRGAEEVLDHDGRALAIGSRAHMVASEAVVKVCQTLF